LPAHKLGEILMCIGPCIVAVTEE